MDAEREDVPRIAVDSLYDWERIKDSYTRAAFAQLDARAAARPPADQERLRAHLARVRPPPRRRRVRLLMYGWCRSWSARLRCVRRTCASTGAASRS